jgi:hypothetical protein
MSSKMRKNNCDPSPIFFFSHSFVCSSYTDSSEMHVALETSIIQCMDRLPISWGNDLQDQRYEKKNDFLFDK